MIYFHNFEFYSHDIVLWQITFYKEFLVLKTNKPKKKKIGGTRGGMTIDLEYSWGGAGQALIQAYDTIWKGHPSTCLLIAAPLPIFVFFCSRLW